MNNKIPTGAATPAETQQKTFGQDFNSDDSTPINEKPLNTSANAQRNSILRYLQKNKSLSTLEAREVLGIMSPAPRIYELRNSNEAWNIQCTRKTEIDVSGTKHNQGEYYLLSGKWEGNL